MGRIGKAFNPYKVFLGVFIPNALLEYKKMSHAAKLCWGVLAQFAGKDGRCFPSRKAIAKKLCLSERQSSDAIRQLREEGFIRCIAPKGQDRFLHMNVTYKFLWHRIFDDSGKSVGEESLPYVEDENLPSTPLIDSYIKDSENIGDAVSSPTFTLKLRRTKDSYGHVLLNPQSLYDESREVRDFLKQLNKVENNHPNLSWKPRNFLKMKITKESRYWQPLADAVKYLFELRGLRANKMSHLYKNYIAAAYKRIADNGYKPQINQLKPTLRSQEYFEDIWIPAWVEENLEPYWLKSRETVEVYDDTGKRIR